MKIYGVSIRYGLGDWSEGVEVLGKEAGIELYKFMRAHAVHSDGVGLYVVDENYKPRPVDGFEAPDWAYNDNSEETSEKEENSMRKMNYDAMEQKLGQCEEYIRDQIGYEGEDVPEIARKWFDFVRLVHEDLLEGKWEDTFPMIQAVFMLHENFNGTLPMFLMDMAAQFESEGK